MVTRECFLWFSAGNKRLANKVVSGVINVSCAFLLEIIFELNFKHGKLRSYFYLLIFVIQYT